MDMNEEPKILEEGESTYRNGGGAMCGGVVSQSTFDSDPWAYMMAFVMPDDRFEQYKICKREKDEKKAKELFDKFAVSMI